MDEILLLSPPTPLSPQKKTMTSTTKKRQPSFMDSNVAVHTSEEPIIQLWSKQTIKTYNTSDNHRKSQADKPNGWNSSKTSTTISNTSSDTPTPLPTFSPTEKTLMRG